MKITCPYCCAERSQSGFRSPVIKFGRYRRKSDCKSIQCYRCLDCKRNFSSGTRHPCARQNKRQINRRLFEFLCSGVSQRRSAKLLKVSRTTIARKLIFLGEQAQLELRKTNTYQAPAEIIAFDDLETAEHTKLKPLSITLAVEVPTRRILGMEVSRMPAKGHLAKLSIKKYGFRKDERPLARERLFLGLTNLVAPEALIKSDENPHYWNVVKKHFPKARYVREKGQRGSVTGQGELKKVRFDPLFHLNHTCAMLRANVNRLFRKTWCLTKKPEKLALHLAMYAVYHNLKLIKPP